jgi:hypothetical protein
MRSSCQGWNLGGRFPKFKLSQPPARVVGYFETSSRNWGSTQMASPTLPVTDAISSSAIPSWLRPTITNSRPVHFSNVDFVGKSR